MSGQDDLKDGGLSRRNFLKWVGAAGAGAAVGALATWGGVASNTTPVRVVPSSGKGTFATSLNCIDGRVQIPIFEWIRQNYSVDYVDMVTEPGVDERISFPEIAEELRKKTEISTSAHNSKLVAVSGHADCAANPVSDMEHMEDIIRGVEVIKSWNLDAEIVGVWVNLDWQVSRV